MSDIWNAITGAFESVLVVIHDFIEPAFGDMAWGWAIIILTLAVRILLLPLAIKQTHSMRAMQELQPRVKALQKKYKTDRDLMRKDPELYRKRKQKLNEEVMALYKEEGVNPASGCLPLLAQMPVFLALFSVLRNSAELFSAKFHFFTGFGNSAAYMDAVESRVFTEAGELTGYGTDLAAHFDVAATPDQVGGVIERFASPGLDMGTNIAGWPGILLIVLMGVTMYLTQRQMMGRNTTADPQQQQTQKIMMYVMPVFLAVISWQLPLGVLLYWVTTNLWQVVQQQIVLREASHPKGDHGSSATGAPAGKTSGGPPAAQRGRGKSGKISDNSPNGGKSAAKPKKPASSPGDSSRGGNGSGRRKTPKKDHLPRRPGT